jgi:hypothetical protein
MTDEQAQADLTTALEQVCTVLDHLNALVEKALANRELFAQRLCVECDKSRALLDAREFIKTRLVPSNEREAIRALKHTVEAHCRGHLRHADFRQALEEDGRFRIKGEFVFCSVVPSCSTPDAKS